MLKMNVERVSQVMDRLTSNRRFYVLLYVVGFLILLPYASKGYSWHEMWSVIKEVVVYNAVIYRLVDLAWPSALLHVLALALIIALAICGERVARAFDIYAFVVYLMIAMGQHIGISEHYGLIVLTGNLALALLVAFSWGWECLVGRNRFRREFFASKRLWLIPLAAWAYWSPLEPFKLNPTYLLIGYFGVSYCFTTPVVLALLALYYPDVNVPVMRLTAFLGLVFGSYNVVPPLVYLALGTYIEEAVWRGTILHFPLLIISVYTLVLTVKASTTTPSVAKGTSLT